MAIDPTKSVTRGVEVKTESPDLREKELHLKDYLEGMKTLDPKAKRDFFAKSLEWDRSGDFEQLRRAGRSSSENTRDSMRKHMLLSSLYLERDPSRSGEMAFKINFGNDLARRKVGLGDMLPPRVKSVKVWNENGEVVSEDAFRAINPETGRIGYYDRKTWDENKTYRYIPVFDNYAFTVLRTGDEKDPEVARHRYAEHMTLYENVRLPASETSPSSLPGRRTASPEKAGGTGPVSAAPDFAPALSGSGEGVDISAARKRITDVARGYINVPRAEFRTPDVKGGYLGCAKVVSTILKEAGFMDQVILGVDNTADYLLRKGWTKSSGPPEAGDVIVWAGLKKQIKGAVDDAPRVATGHKHIGIALGPNLAVSNSSSKGMPTEHAIYVGRPVEMFLKPPQAGAKPAVAVDAGKTKSDTGYLDASLNTRITSKLWKYEPLMAEAAQKYGVPKNLIMAVMFQESGGDPLIASHAGAGGLMQLMPATARGLGMTNVFETIKTTNSRGRTVYRLDPRDDRADPYKCIMAGARILSGLLKRHNGNIELALASYNWGSGNVDKYLNGRKNMPEETRNYISRIPKMYNSLNNAEKSA